MANTSPTAALAQIVQDMHQLRAVTGGPVDRDDIDRIAAAVRTLAEAVLALHAPQQTTSVTVAPAALVIHEQRVAELNRIDARRAAQSPAETQKQHLDTFGGGR